MSERNNTVKQSVMMDAAIPATPATPNLRFNGLHAHAHMPECKLRKWRSWRSFRSLSNGIKHLRDAPRVAFGVAGVAADEPAACGQPFPSAHGTSGFVSVVAAPAPSACKPLSSAVNQSGYPYSGHTHQAQQTRKFTPIASILFRGRRSNSKLERTLNG